MEPKARGDTFASTEVIEAQPLTDWEEAIYAFLAEKQRRSGSMRTVDAYSRTLRRFFGMLGKTPDQVAPPEVFAFAHGIRPSGRQPATRAISARLACISSFYRFLIRMGLAKSNPCDQLERPRTSSSVPRGLSPTEIKRLLAVIPETSAGLRDRAIIVTLLLTGRRRSEVMNLRHAIGRLVLHVPRQGREDWQARVAEACVRGDRACAHGLGKASRRDVA
jgi:site-specific recombinase XerD